MTALVNILHYLEGGSKYSSSGSKAGEMGLAGSQSTTQGSHSKTTAQYYIMFYLLPALLLLPRLGLADSRNTSRFPCPPRPGLIDSPAAAEVTKLAPHNIGMVKTTNFYPPNSDVVQVASLGDSITAGTGAGARHLVEVLHEYRGATYLTGADPGTASLHNFIKQYNPALLGGSRGSTKAHMSLD